SRNFRMKANKRELDAPLGFALVKELMSMLYRRIYQNIADGKLSFVFINRPLRGEKSNLWRFNNG
ncbi:unnamed protein product, partial [marine sediment metagenome]